MLVFPVLNIRWDVPTEYYGMGKPSDRLRDSLRRQWTDVFKDFFEQFGAWESDWVGAWESSWDKPSDCIQKRSIHNCYVPLLTDYQCIPVSC